MGLCLDKVEGEALWHAAVIGDEDCIADGQGFDSTVPGGCDGSPGGAGLRQRIADRGHVVVAAVCAICPQKMEATVAVGAGQSRVSLLCGARPIGSWRQCS